VKITTRIETAGRRASSEPAVASFLGEGLRRLVRRRTREETADRATTEAAAPSPENGAQGALGAFRFSVDAGLTGGMIFRLGDDAGQRRGEHRP
jgi:hypothetical protein